MLEMPVTKMNNHEKAKALVTTLAIQSVREQIQEDIICFIDSVVPASTDEYRKNALCQIVVDNFKKLEK